MARPRKPTRSASPLDETQRQIAAEEHKLQAQIIALQREIEQAPVRAAEEKRQRRAALKESSKRDHARPRAAGNQRAGRRLTPMLKAERRAQRLKTLALFVVLVVILGWLAMSYL